MEEEKSTQNCLENDNDPLLLRQQQPAFLRSDSPVPSVSSSSVANAGYSAATLTEVFKVPSRAMRHSFRKVRNMLMIIVFLFIVPFYAAALFMYLFQWTSQRSIELFEIPVTHFLAPHLFTLLVTILSVVTGFKAVYNMDMYWLNLHWYVSLVDTGMQLVLLVGAVIYSVMLFNTVVWFLVLYIVPALGVAARIVECYFTHKLHKTIEDEHKAYLAGMMLAEVL